jgi:CRP/FNR family transcriptional regulator, cyclic AMP receptor protein
MTDRTPRRRGEADEDPFDAAPMSDSLRTLARRGELRRLRKHQILINEGDRGDTLFVVLSGQLRAYSAGIDDRQVTYAHYGAGEYVGEMSLDGGPRAADVEATQPTLVALVTRPTLEQHLRDDPSFAFDLLSKVIRRARAATLSLKRIALNDTYGRLKPLLESLCTPQADGRLVADPAPSHEELGHMLVCTREMVTKLMGDLRTGGYIDARRRYIELVKPLPAKW